MTKYRQKSPVYFSRLKPKSQRNLFPGGHGSQQLSYFQLKLTPVSNAVSLRRGLFTLKIAVSS
ncbi:MAG: hypothetical protein V7K70_01285 [Nostoc sp.]